MLGIFSRSWKHAFFLDPTHRKIAQGFILVSLFVFLGKLAGAAKEMTIAWRYGVSEKVDAYVFICNVITWPVSIWFSILTVVLIPLAAHLRGNSSSDLPRFRAELLGLTLLLGLFFALLGWLVLPRLLRNGWLGLSGQALNTALEMICGLTLLAPLGVIVSLFSVWLLAAGHHRNTLFEAIPAFTLMVFLLLPQNWMPEPLLWGSVSGYALHMAALAAPLYRSKDLQSPLFTQHSPAWQSFWRSIGIMAAGQALMSLTGLIDQFYAAGLEEGALSSLNYANRVLALILGLGATAIGRVTLPVFSEMLPQDIVGMRRITLHWAMLMFVSGIVGLLVGWLLSPWGVALLFERGSFTASDTRAVTMLLRYSILQMPFYFASLVFVSALAAQRRHGLIVLSGVLNLLFKWMFIVFLVDAYQLKGLVFSTVAMYALSSVILFVFFLRVNRYNAS